MSEVVVKIGFDKKKLAEGLRALGRKGVATAANLAINEALKGARTEAVGELFDVTGARSKRAIRRRMSLRLSNRRKLSGYLKIRPMGLPLNSLKTAKGRAGRKGGVWNRGKKIDRSFVTKAQRLSRGRRDFWAREGTARAPLKRLYGFTLTQEYRHHEVEDDLRRKAQKRFNKAWERHFARELKRQGF